MGDAREPTGVGGFWSFYRGYTDTSVHTATMAALTAFGLLTFVHRAFALVAVGAYVLPPVVLYLTGRTGVAADDAGDGAETDTPRSAGTKFEGDADALDPTESDDGSPRGAEEAPTAPASAAPGADSDGGEGPDGAARTDANADAPAEWTTEETPTDATLRDVTRVGSGAIAVGDGGVILGRDPGSGGGADSADGSWTVLISDGPAADGRDLTGVDATDDGAAAWFCGANGAVGRYDAGAGRHADHSAPRDVTDSWTDVAVAGGAGEETVYLANGSGEVVRGTVSDGETSWDAPVTPGSGSSIAAVDAAPDGDVWACDTSGGVFESTVNGEDMTFARVGVDGASGTFTDVAASVGRVGVRVSSDDGSVYRDDAGWTRDRPVEVRLAGVDVDADAAVAVGDAGTVCVDIEAGWTTASVPTDASLESVHLGTAECTAVGDAGTVVCAKRTGGARATGP